MNTVVAFFKDGGPLMFVNIAVLVFALAVICERAFMLYFRFRINSRVFLLEIEKSLNAGNFPKAIKLCKDQVAPLMPRLVLAAINAFQVPSIEAWERAIDESKADIQPTIARRINLLWPIANIATLIGLVGTVFGLIGAFKGAGALSAELKAQALTKGISEAMNNTAFGLSIALICTLGHMILSNTTKGLNEDIEFAAHRMVNILAKLMSERARGASTGGMAPTNEG